MAAKKRNHSEIGAGGGHAKPLHFFKVILEDTLESGKLRLPKRFCRIYEKDLRNLNAVTLKVPNTGDVWEVRLTKCRNGEFWFENGWKEFACFYSIELGYFVVFKWEAEKSQFQVIIMNKTMTEVQYPSKCIVKVEPSDDEDDDVPVKIMSDHSRIKKSPLSSCRSSKKMKRSIGEASSSRHGKAHTDHRDKSGGKLNFSESRAPPQGSDFVSKYPFFQTVIKSGFLSHGLMSLPISFARSNIDWNCRKQILTFITDGGRSWHAKLSCNPETMKNSMYAGLSTFLKENFVKAGNLCTFELIDREQMVFRVHIHRTKNVCSERASCSSKMANADMHGELDFSTVTPPQPGSEFASKYPFFQATISKTAFIHRQLTVSWTFVRENMNTECHQTVTLETDDGRSWPVKVTYNNYPKRQARLYGGLKDFLKENKLKEGDFCTFELINKENMVFRVSIYRG